MTNINPNSLSETLDHVNDALFNRRKIPASEKKEIARWIAGRQGMPNSYANMFAPTDKEVRNGIRLFSGDQVKSGAAIRHVMGEEASRTLLLLKVRDKTVNKALRTATENILSRLEESKPESPGFF